jgi:hypothetical protein
MRTLTDDEKRKMRWAAIGIAAYLAIFGGFQMWKFMEKRRTDYQHLVSDARDLRVRMQLYQDKAQVVKRMMEDFHLDPATLSRETIVGEASSAIQKAAAASGIQVGTVRESAARGSGDEVASMQFEGSGPVPAVTALLNRMQALGYPLVIDSVQITPDNRPGNVKVSLTIAILDFERWKTGGQSHA